MNEKITSLPVDVRARWAQFDGEWLYEPDRVEWRDAATGLPCLALRHTEYGHWCGYVGVAPGHPWHGKTEETGAGADVHGGITFASECQASILGEHRVCHTPLPGEADDVWWLGFDCAHAGDLSPGMLRMGNDTWRRDWETYKNLAFVRTECARLAQQAAAETRP